MSRVEHRWKYFSSSYGWNQLGSASSLLKARMSHLYTVVGRVIKRWETSVTCCRLNHNLLLFVVQLIYFSFVVKKHGLGPKNCTCHFSLQDVFNFFFLPDSQGPKLKRERGVIINLLITKWNFRRAMKVLRGQCNHKFH